MLRIAIYAFTTWLSDQVESNGLETDEEAIVV